MRAPDAAGGIPVCDGTNLLSGLSPKAEGDTRGSFFHLTDGKIYEDGALWDSSEAVIIGKGGQSASLLYDLGRESAVSSGWIQADNNDLYTLEGSTDGKDFKPLALFSPISGPGLRIRWLKGLNGTARYIRLSANGGDGYYSVSELGLFCARPSTLPPHVEIVRSPKENVGGSSLNDLRVTLSKAFIVGLALLIFGWGLWLKRIKRPRQYYAVRMTLLGIVAVFAFSSYYNFFQWHFPDEVHTWEVYHYHTGSKYFPELRYARLYECTTIADAEEGMGEEVQKRRIRDHRTNEIRKPDYALTDPGLCKKHFSEKRWKDFKKDLEWFRGRMEKQRWEDMQKDHGYNPPPVWTMFGRALASIFPTTTEGIHWLVRLDIVIVLVAFAFIGWAFGWEIMCLAIILWGTNYPSRFYWIGGAYLRQSWFASAMIGLSLLKKEKYAASAVTLTLSALITVFPILFLAGPGIKILRQWIKTKALGSKFKRFIGGCILGGAALILLSIPASGGGFGVYGDFASQIAVHMGTPLTNNMGLRTVLSFRPEKRAQKTMTLHGGGDDFSIWKIERNKAFRSLKPVYYAILLGFIILFWRGTKDALDWEAAAMGFVLIPVFTELTCYYYSFATAGAMLTARRPKLSLPLLLTNLAWLYGEFNFAWFDVKYTYESAIALLLCLYVILTLTIPLHTHASEKENAT